MYSDSLVTTLFPTKFGLIFEILKDHNPLTY